MKKLYLILIAVALLSVAALAQSKKTEQVKAWKQFQTATAKSDEQAVAAMIQFPFEASIVGENLNYKIETEAAFIKNYSKICTESRRAKILRGKIVSLPGEDEFHFEMQEIGGFQAFTFRKIGGKYLLTDTMAAG